MWIKMETGESVNFDLIRKIFILGSETEAYSLYGVYSNGDIISLSNKYTSFQTISIYKQKVDNILVTNSL
jgi:hypothetical protein